MLRTIVVLSSSLVIKNQAFCIIEFIDNFLVEMVDLYVIVPHIRKW